MGVQNGPPQAVPQWHADYLELEAILTSESGETLDPPSTTVYRAGQTSVY